MAMKTRKFSKFLVQNDNFELFILFESAFKYFMENNNYRGNFRLQNITVPASSIGSSARGTLMTNFCPSTI